VLCPHSLDGATTCCYFDKQCDWSSLRCKAKPSRWLQSAVTTMHVIYWAPSIQCTSYFLSSSVVSCALSVLCMYSKFVHHPHPQATFVPNFYRWASPWRKIAYSVLTHSVTHLIWCSENRSFRFKINTDMPNNRGYVQVKWYLNDTIVQLSQKVLTCRVPYSFSCLTSLHSTAHKLIMPEWQELADITSSWSSSANSNIITSTHSDRHNN